MSQNHVSLHLHRGRELSSLQRDVPIQHDPLPDGLGIAHRELLIVLLHSRSQVGVPRLVLRGLLARRGLAPELLGLRQHVGREHGGGFAGGGIGLGLQAEHAREVILAVAHHDGVAHLGQQLGELVLDGHGRHVLAAAGHDELLDSPGEIHEPVLVDASLVARVDPPVLVQRLLRLLRHLEVPHHHVASAVLQLVHVSDADRHAGHRLPAGAQLPQLLHVRVRRERRAALALPQQIVDGDVELREEPQRLDVHRRGADHQSSALPEPQLVPNALEDQAVREPVAPRPVVRLAELPRHAARVAHAHGPVDQLTFEALEVTRARNPHGGLVDRALDLGLHFLVETRHGDADGGLRVLQRVHQRALQRVGVADVHADVVEHRDHRVHVLRRDVVQRQEGRLSLSPLSLSLRSDRGGPDRSESEFLRTGTCTNRG